LKLIQIFNIIGFGHRNENIEDWLNIDTIRIPCKIIYLLNTIYYKNPTEFYRNRLYQKYKKQVPEKDE